MTHRRRWFAVRKELHPQQRQLLLIAAFVAPLLLWSAVSYVPFVWHPMMKVTDPGDVSIYAVDALVNRVEFRRTNAETVAEGQRPAVGKRANPVFLPAPHEVARALVTSFMAEPRRTGDLWLHQSLWNSIQVIFWGFVAASLIGVPLGLICGSFGFFARILEPFVDFIRYMPAPAFGPLMVAVFGIYVGPKVAIIFIGTFFQMVLVIAHTTRLLDRGLIEAGQTLGASTPQLVTRVILPGILPNLYNDLRILLGWAWTYLIVAELIGSVSGISFFIYQQARYKNFDNVFAGIIIIGLIGLLTDQVLAFIGKRLFPWQ
ncbi:MAG: ABC transporter permease subunit [Candidatus Poribacteria bacterium]|nr:ABC transporter permease subunit [Candidatus Poribacteria bacterium]